METDPHAIASQEAWDEFNLGLPGVIKALLAAEPFQAANPPTSKGRGIYLFSDEGEHLYVGRTGVTTRSRKEGKEPSTSFAARWGQHTAHSSPPHSAPFAMKLARELAAAFDLLDPVGLKTAGKIQKTAEWWGLRKAKEPPGFYFAFQEAKRFIREELEFRFVDFVDDHRGVRSHVTEVYVDAILQTTYGDFSPS